MPRLRAVVLGVVCSWVMSVGIAPARAQDNSKPQDSAAKTQEETKAQSSAKIEPAKTEPAKADSAKAESAKTEPAKGQIAANNSTPAPDFSKEPVVYEKVRAVMQYESDGTGTKEMSARIRVQSYTGVQQIG